MRIGLKLALLATDILLGAFHLSSAWWEELGLPQVEGPWGVCLPCDLVAATAVLVGWTLVSITKATFDLLGATRDFARQRPLADNAPAQDVAPREEKPADEDSPHE